MDFRVCLFPIVLLTGCTTAENDEALGRSAGAVIGGLATDIADDPQTQRFAGSPRPKISFVGRSVSVSSLPTFQATVILDSYPKGAEVWYQGEKSKFLTPAEVTITHSCFDRCERNKMILRMKGYVDYEITVLQGLNKIEVNLIKI